MKVSKGKVIVANAVELIAFSSEESEWILVQKETETKK